MKAVSLDLPEAHARVLVWLLDNIPPDEIPWVLTGSAGLRLQGVDLPVNDLDIETRGEYIGAVEQQLKPFIVTPVREWETGHIRSLDGKAVMDGIQIEILADVAFRGVDGNWEPPTDVLGLQIFVHWRGRSVPVLPLEHEADSYKKMGRLERAGLIRSFLASRKP